LNKTLNVSDSFSVRHQEFFTVHTGIGICHIGLLRASEQDQDETVLILLASCQQTCMTYTYCCVYSEKLLMMDRRAVRNM